MQQIEVRNYSRNEMAQLLKVEITDSHFSRKVQSILTKWGYSFVYSRKAIQITAAPSTAQERLNELLIREFDLDIRIDIGKFATFVYLLMDEEFSSMPFGERANVMKQDYNIEVSEITLKRWYKKLVDNNVVETDRLRKTYWVSMYIDGQKVRMKVDEDDEGKIKYENRRRKLAEQNIKDGMNKADAYSSANLTCWKEFKCCYYSCNTIILNAFNQQFFELAEEVFDNGDCDYAFVYTCHLEQVKQNKNTKFEF